MKIKLLFFLSFFLFFACKTKQINTEIKAEIEPKQKFISLYKGACYGKCPVYKLTINGDGSFIYFGKSNVQYLGAHKGFIPSRELKPMFDKLETYTWNKYPEQYPIDNVDFPQFTLEYYDGKLRKKIHANSNAAKELIALAESLDLLSQQLTMEKLN